MQTYKIIDTATNTVKFIDTLSRCLFVLAAMIGGYTGREHVTVKQAMESPYRLVRA